MKPNQTNDQCTDWMNVELAAAAVDLINDAKVKTWEK